MPALGAGLRTLNPKLRLPVQPFDLYRYRRREKNASWPVSRVLYGPRLAARTWRPFILGACCHAPHATYPDGGPETALEGFPSHRPYSVLLPVGFAVPLLLPVARWALTPPFHPCRGNAAAVCFLWHFPWGRPRRPLAGTVSPWSPDFPHPQPFGSRGRGRPASWQARIKGFPPENANEKARRPNARRLGATTRIKRARWPNPPR